MGSAMLILTRRIGETVCVGDAITVTVLGVQGTQVRIGLNAPREVQIDREEVRARKQREALREVMLPAQSTAIDGVRRSHSTRAKE